MFFRADKTHAVSFLNGFKNPCLSRNLGEGGMKALMVNYILIKKKRSMFGYCQRFRELLVEMLPKRVFREPKSFEEEKEYLDSCIPKSMRYATRWAYIIFGKWQS